MTTLLAPFLIGLAGSLHCIGMCSPLAMAAGRAGRNAVFRNLQYNLGRILTYGILGSVVSFAGRGLQLAGLQQWVSIVAGVTLLGIGITNVRVTSPAYIQSSVIRFSNILKDHFRQLLNSRNTFGTVMLGMINGLLPCGMTLVAMGYCVTLAGPWDGFFAMILFGAGTLPAMLGIASIARSALGRLRIRYNKLQAGLIIICAIILIGRGMWNDHASKESATGEDEIVVCGDTVAR